MEMVEKVDSGELIVEKVDSGELIDRANGGELEVVRRLLEVRADVNGSTAGGATALHRAAYHDHLAVAEALVAAGANLEMKDHSFGSTPLHAAAVGRAASVAEFLVASGADWRSQNKAGRTPLDLAEEQASIDVIAVLKNVEREDQERQAQHKKLCLAMMVAVKQAKPEDVSRLLQDGADANWQPVRGRTAIVEAAERNHVAVMEVLVAAKADLDRADVTGCTALMVAANYGSAAATQFLLRNGADDSLADDFGRTALAIAKDHKKAEVVRTLQQWMAGQIDSDSPMPMGRGPVPIGRTHQRWPSQVRDLPAGFMIEDGRLPSDVGPPLRLTATDGSQDQEKYGGLADHVVRSGHRTATLSERSSLGHAYAASMWDAGGAGGLVVQTALDLCETESETTHSRGTHSREAQRSRGSVSFDLAEKAM
jgi:ankyrin repeat protein